MEADGDVVIFNAGPNFTENQNIHFLKFGLKTTKLYKVLVYIW